MVGSIHNRIAAFEHLAETSKTQSGVMSIGPTSNRGFSSMKSNDSPIKGKETYGAAASVSSSRSSPSVSSRDKDAPNNISNALQDMGGNNRQLLQDVQHQTPQKVGGANQQNQQNDEGLAQENLQNENKMTTPPPNRTMPQKAKSFSEILEEEDKKLDLEDGPVTVITVSSKSSRDLSNEKGEDCSDEGRDEQSVSPLSFLEYKIDTVREEAPSQTNADFSPTIGTIDEHTALNDSTRALADIHPGVLTKDTQASNADPKSTFDDNTFPDFQDSTNVDPLAKKPIMNPVQEDADFFSFFELDGVKPTADEEEQKPSEEQADALQRPLEDKVDKSQQPIEDKRETLQQPSEEQADTFQQPLKEQVDTLQQPIKEQADTQEIDNGQTTHSPLHEVTSLPIVDDGIKNEANQAANEVTVPDGDSDDSSLAEYFQNLSPKDETFDQMEDKDQIVSTPSVDVQIVEEEHNKNDDGDNGDGDNDDDNRSDENENSLDASLNMDNIELDDTPSMDADHVMSEADNLNRPPTTDSLGSKFDDLWNEHESLKSKSPEIITNILPDPTVKEEAPIVVVSGNTMEEENPITTIPVNTFGDNRETNANDDKAANAAAINLADNVMGLLPSEWTKNSQPKTTTPFDLFEETGADTTGQNQSIEPIELGEHQHPVTLDQRSNDANEEIGISSHNPTDILNGRGENDQAEATGIQMDHLAAPIGVNFNGNQQSNQNPVQGADVTEIDSGRNSPYHMYSLLSNEDEIKPVATLSFDGILPEIEGRKSEEEQIMMAGSLIEMDDISDTTPFAEIIDDDSMKDIEEAHFVNNEHGTNQGPTFSQQEDMFSYLNSPPQDNHQLNASENTLLTNNVQRESNNFSFDDRGHSGPQEFSVHNGHAKMESTQHIVQPSQPSEMQDPFQYDMPIEMTQSRPSRPSTSGPPLTFRNNFNQIDDGDSVGLSVLTEDTYARRNDDASLMTYSVSEKSHTSTSISQGGQKPKKRPTSGVQDPSKPLPIFRTASTLRDNPTLHNAHSTISELTGLDSVSLTSNGKRMSTNNSSNTPHLSTITSSPHDNKPDTKRPARGVSPFSRRRRDHSVDSAYTHTTKSSFHQHSVAHSEKTKNVDNRYQEGRGRNKESRKPEKKRRGFSLRSLSPWRSSRNNQKFSNNHVEDHDIPETNKGKGRRRPSRSRNSSRPNIQKTPSQMIRDEERAETSIPLVAVSPSQDSSKAKKPARRFSFRSLSPFSRLRKKEKKKKSRADPFDEGDSL